MSSKQFHSLLFCSLSIAVCASAQQSAAAGAHMNRDSPPVSITRPVGGTLAPTLHSALITTAESKAVLETTPRCRDWVGVTYGNSVLLTFIVYPERSDRAPVVFVSAKREGFTPWVRAVSDQVAADGFIAVAGDVLTNAGPRGGDSESFATAEARNAMLARLGPAEIARREKAIRDFSLALPAADGKSAALELDSSARSIHAKSGVRAQDFPLSSEGWRAAMDFLTVQTGNHPQMGAEMMMGMDMGMGAMDPSEHAAHMGMMPGMEMPHGGVLLAQQGSRASAGGGATSTIEKQPNLPAGHYTARATLAASKLRKEWIDIPYGDIKLHTWVEYPAGEGKAGVIIVMQYGTGMDEWVRSVADQLAQEGFIAVAPDAWSGTGPNGGGIDSFEFVDDAMRAGAKITGDEKQRRYKAAWDWAMKLPRANGKSGSIGFCDGGGQSFRFAALNPALSAAVVYFGTPPDDAEMARIKAPVIGFYGENDARVTSTVAPTIEKMEKLGKVYESHIYPKTTHSFLYFQEMAGNPAATLDSWPRAIAFFKKNLSN